tara:strand:+ start:476 stop:1318 length:843 start_codon:yes stop_codon:yes gene_type:complete
MLDIMPCLYDVLLNDLGNDWHIEFNDLNGIGYDLDIERSIIMLNNFGLRPDCALKSPYFRPQIILHLVEALRMTRHVEWLEGMLERYDPQTIILIGRVCVADTTVQKIKFAWESKIDGDTSLWKHILCGEHTDIATAFESSLEKYLTASMDLEQAQSKAMAVAFNQWFSNNERVNDCDHDTLDLVDGMIADYARFEGRRLEKNAITCLTFIPGQDQSYLDRYLQEDILKNPYYSLVSDPINHIHFTQILSDMNTVRVGGLVFSDRDLAARFIVSEDIQIH